MFLQESVSNDTGIESQTVPIFQAIHNQFLILIFCKKPCPQLNSLCPISDTKDTTSRY